MGLDIFKKEVNKYSIVAVVCCVIVTLLLLISFHIRSRYGYTKYQMFQMFLSPLIIVLTVVVVFLAFLVWYKFIKVVNEPGFEAKKPKLKRNEKLPPYSWGRTFLISFIVIMLTIILFYKFYLLSLNRFIVYDFFMIFFLLIGLIEALQPMSAYYFMKKVYPITLTPYTRTWLILFEKYPERFKKMYKIIGIILVFISLIYLVCRYLIIF